MCCINELITHVVFIITLLVSVWIYCNKLFFLQKGNIAESLLKEGFAKCVDWTIATVTGGPEKLRAAERFAKEKKLRLWQDYKPSTLQVTKI